VIDAELGREDHGSIPATTIGRGLEPLDVRTDPKPDSTNGERKKKVTTVVYFYLLAKQNLLALKFVLSRQSIL
jgi:hypothetical protein